MQFIIHRGAKEIGGSCVEVFTDNTCLIIDCGIPLDDKKPHPFDPKSLLDRKIDAVLLSHPHLDHYGLLNTLNPNIPIYMSQGAKKIIEASEIFGMHKVGKLNAKTLIVDKTNKIGDFTITNYLVDHSGFDARAFLIEANGKRLFYSGDFRGHGRKSSVFKKMLANPPKNIDCLLMEGSTLERSKAEYQTEDDVEKAIENILKTSTTVTFLAVSAQNIDRLVSAYRACLRNRSRFIIDLYTAFVLHKLKWSFAKIPQFDWNNIKVFYWGRQGNKLVQNGYKPLLYKYKISKIKAEETKTKDLFIIRNSKDLKRIMDNGVQVEGSTFIYSMWEGYLNDELKSFCKDNKIKLKQIHVSGHATIDHLKEFAKALKPKKLVPFHTFSPEKYKKLFGDKVKIANDGEMVEV